MLEAGAAIFGVVSKYSVTTVTVHMDGLLYSYSDVRRVARIWPILRSTERGFLEVSNCFPGCVRFDRHGNGAVLGRVSEVSVLPEYDCFDVLTSPDGFLPKIV